MVGVDTASYAEFNLPGSHAYTVMGAYYLKDSSGNVVHRLYRVRNPWGIDVYTGPWCDSSSLWTDAFKAQVPYINNKNDGAFFIEDTDLVKAFNDYQIGFVHDDYAHSYYSKVADSGSLASYTFTTTKTEEVFVTVGMYGFR